MSKRIRKGIVMLVVAAASAAGVASTATKAQADTSKESLVVRYDTSARGSYWM